MREAQSETPEASPTYRGRRARLYTEPAAGVRVRGATSGTTLALASGAFPGGTGGAWDVAIGEPIVLEGAGDVLVLAQLI